MSNLKFWRNWAGNQQSLPREWLVPGSEEELAQQILAADQLRPHGSGHSFTPLVPSTGALVGLDGMAGVQKVDKAGKRAWLGAGTKLRDIGPALHEHGLAMANMGDIDAQTLAGAISTGTHGTGHQLGCLATQVTALRLVDGTGKLREMSADDPKFAGALVGLGALGVVTAYELQCLPSYNLVDRRWNVHLSYLLENWKHASTNTRHFEFFWFPYTDEALCKSLHPAEDGAALSFSAERAAALAERERQVLEATSWIARWVPRSSRAVQGWLTQQSLGISEISGHSWQIFPSARDCRFVEMEYCLPEEALEPCLRELAPAIRNGRISGSYPVEVRRVQADKLWLSPFSGRDSVTIAVHQHHRHNPRQLFDTCEAIFRAHQGRPHWGKMHSRTAAELAELYPQWDKFQKLRAECDPQGRFLNPHLREVFGVG